MLCFKRLALLVGLTVSIYSFSTAANAQISLGTAGSFGALGGAAVNNTGPTIVNGNVGVSPGTSITGFPPGSVVGGSFHANDAVAMQAQNDLTVAYNELAGMPCNVQLTGQDLGGLTLVPGVYCFSTSAQLTGTLTLDAQGNPNALFIFKMGSSLTTASNSNVTVINGGSNCNVYWQVGSSATLGTGTSFGGNILALASITMTTGSSISGRALARTGAVTLDSNSVNICGAGPVCPIVSVLPATLPNATLNLAYSQSVSGSGGTGPYTYTLSSGQLPPGLSLNALTGAITGAPTAIGSFTFTVTATDANGCFGSRNYTINVALPGCPVISLDPSSLPPAINGQPYSQSVTASGGVPPYTYSVTTGALPAGLTLNPASGLISGTSTVTGLFNFTITATDVNGCLGARPYTLLSAAPLCPTLAISPTLLPSANVGSLYSQLITASGGLAPYTYAVTSGALPAGLVLNPTSGLLSGTPVGTGTANFTITATDANGCQVVLVYALQVLGPICPTILVNPATLPTAIPGTPYAQFVTASGGVAPYTFSVSAGSLPTGLVLNPSTGLISGTPTAIGAFNFTITATDANQCAGSRPYALVLTLATLIAVPALSTSALLGLLVSIGLLGMGSLWMRRAGP